jgi:hypothetical protein
MASHGKKANCTVNNSAGRMYVTMNSNTDTPAAIKKRPVRYRDLRFNFKRLLSIR